MPGISMNVFATCAVANDGTLTAKHRHSNECRNKVRMVISWLTVAGYYNTCPRAGARRAQVPKILFR